MDGSQFDRVARFLAGRVPRRDALRFAHQETAATAAAADVGGSSASGERVSYLFVQSFQQCSIAPLDGVDGRYTLTLEAGLGQTVFFADRPSRDAGAVPTPLFLDGLGFGDDNPPNAALVTRTDAGEEIAVVELFNPTHDEATLTATYEIEMLANWEQSLAFGVTGAPVDPAVLTSEFGPAHLFIDGCEAKPVACCSGEYDENGRCLRLAEFFESVDFCWSSAANCCLPCGPSPGGSLEVAEGYWTNRCNQAFPTQCAGACIALWNS